MSKLEIMNSIIQVSSLVTFAIGVYQFSEQKSDNELKRITESWQTIERSENRHLNGGRTAALEFLHKRNQNMFGLNLSKASLIGLKLPPNQKDGAQLQHSNFSNSKLSYSYLVKANLGYVKFSTYHPLTDLSNQTELIGVNLTGANLIAAKFSQANIKFSCFRNVIFNSQSQFEFSSESDFEGADFEGAKGTEKVIVIIGKSKKTTLDKLISSGKLRYKTPSIDQARIHGCDLSI